MLNARSVWWTYKSTKQFLELVFRERWCIILRCFMSCMGVKARWHWQLFPRFFYLLIDANERIVVNAAMYRCLYLNVFNLSTTSYLPKEASQAFILCFPIFLIFCHQALSWLTLSLFLLLERTNKAILLFPCLFGNCLQSLAP